MAVSELEAPQTYSPTLRGRWLRYNIINEEDLAQGVAQRFNCKRAANTEGAANETDALTSSRSTT